MQSEIYQLFAGPGFGLFGSLLGLAGKKIIDLTVASILTTKTVADLIVFRDSPEASMIALSSNLLSMFGMLYAHKRIAGQQAFD